MPVCGAECVVMTGRRCRSHRRRASGSLTDPAAVGAPAPCAHPSQVGRTGCGRLEGRRLAHACCARCERDWWELDGRPVAFRVVSDLLALRYARLARRG